MGTAKRLLTGDGVTLVDGTRIYRDLGRDRDAVLRKDREVPADAPGYELKPDPLKARSAAELILLLREYRAWAGDPSFREMARASRQRASASAICTAVGDGALAAGQLPRLPVVLAVVTGSGGSPEDASAWATAWRMLRVAGTARPASGGLRSVAAG